MAAWAAGSLCGWLGRAFCREKPRLLRMRPIEVEASRLPNRSSQMRTRSSRVQAEMPLAETPRLAEAGPDQDRYVMSPMRRSLAILDRTRWWPTGHAPARALVHDRPGRRLAEKPRQASISRHRHVELCSAVVPAPTRPANEPTLAPGACLESP